MSIESAVEGGRRLLESTLLDTGRIERPTLVSDEAGGQTETLVVIATVPCRFGPVVDVVPNTHVGAVFGPSMSAIFCALGTNVREKDHIVNVSNGDVWLIVGDKTPASNMAVVMRLNARRI